MPYQIDYYIDDCFHNYGVAVETVKAVKRRNLTQSYKLQYAARL
jgi:hypothetical protein